MSTYNESVAAALAVLVVSTMIWLVVLPIALYFSMSRALGFLLNKRLFLKSILIWIIKRWNIRTFLSTLLVMYLVWVGGCIMFFLGYYWFGVALVPACAILPAVMILRCKRAIYNDR